MDEKNQVKKINLKAKLDRIFSLYIRLRDSNDKGQFKCISCGQIKPFEQADCGHYIGRQYMNTRYNEKNNNAQCRYCNRFNEGQHVMYRKGLVEKYGEQEVLKIEASKHIRCRYFPHEYELLINVYKNKVKELRKEKMF